MSEAKEVTEDWGFEVAPLVRVNLHAGTKGEKPKPLEGEQGGLSYHGAEGDGHHKLREKVKHHQDDTVSAVRVGVRFGEAAPRERARARAINRRAGDKRRGLITGTGWRAARRLFFRKSPANTGAARSGVTKGMPTRVWLATGRRVRRLGSWRCRWGMWAGQG